jgi:hypothetical protein
MRNLYFFIFLFATSINIEARPSIVNIDSVYKYSDFCDKVEIIYSGSSQLSVRSKLDSLTYTFYTNSFLNKNSDGQNVEYILIRGRASSDLNSKNCLILGELKGDEYAFHKWDRDFLFYTSTNPIAKIDNSGIFEGQIKYPKTYFKFKTPSLFWSEEEREHNMYFISTDPLIRIKLKKINSQFINDSIHVNFEKLDTGHVKLTMHLKTRFSQHDYVSSILKSIGLPYKDIVEGSEKSTSDFLYNCWIYSYSNAKYKLITYKVHEFEEEKTIIMELHK